MIDFEVPGLSQCGATPKVSTYVVLEAGLYDSGIEVLASFVCSFLSCAEDAEINYGS